MKTASAIERTAEQTPGENDEPSGSSSSEPRQPRGRARTPSHAPIQRLDRRTMPITFDADPDAPGAAGPSAPRHPSQWLRTHIQRAIEQALSRHNQPPLNEHDAIRISIVADRRMAELHLRLCDQPGTTDVITIDMNRTASEAAGSAVRPLDVDLILCADEAARQAAQRAHTPDHELLLYALHAILHTLGHDDHTDDGYAAMHAMEDDILTAIGVGPVFSAGDDREAAS
ncbi:MAG: rRNA maturation RNase YbeY [Phycisphaerales bacterium]